MPNNIINRLRIYGDKTGKEIANLIDFIKGDNIDNWTQEKSLFDFNKITNEPDPDKNPKWQEWRLANWDTKWNAYGTQYTFDGVMGTLIFYTAWSSVPKLIAKLSALFPQLMFDYDWADEDISYNVGHLHFYDGKLQSVIDIPFGSKEAYEHCFDLGIADPSRFKLVDGNYEYIEIE